MKNETPYAVIQSGSKQYWVKVGDIIDVEILPEMKGAFECREVLFYSDGKKCEIGKPHLASASVLGEVLGEVKGPKVIAYKYKKRKKLRHKVGHRQTYHRVKITELKI